MLSSILGEDLSCFVFVFRVLKSTSLSDLRLYSLEHAGYESFKREDY